VQGKKKTKENKGRVKEQESKNNIKVYTNNEKLK
jgi:hypothetical protein